MALSVIRGGEMQNEGPGEMASSLKSESMLLIHVGSHGLFSASQAEVAGAEGQCCRSQAQGCRSRSARSLPWLLLQCLSQALLACGRTSRTRKSVHGLLFQKPGVRGMWQSNKTERENMVPISFRAE